MEGEKMNLSDEKVSQALAAVMGVCWHEWERIPAWESYTYRCKLCGTRNPEGEQFSAFTPNGIWQWKSYMEENLFDMWDSFVEENFKPALTDEFSWSWCLDNAFDPRRFVRYLFDNLDGWGYEICTEQNRPSDCMQDRPECEMRLINTGKRQCLGKVLTERARKFKAILEGE
jgi:hypothetical protein